MSKFSNCVRFIVKEGKNADFLAVYEQNKFEVEGMEHHFVIQTGDREFIGIGIWDAKESLVAGRTTMISSIHQCSSYCHR